MKTEHDDYDDDDDDSESEEEILVFANFRDSADDFVADNVNHIIKTIGIDTETPLIQLDNNAYRGNYDNSFGTYLFLEDNPDPPEVDPIFGQPIEHPLSYACKSGKILNMDKVFIKPNYETAPDEDTSTSKLQTQSSTTREAIDRLAFYFQQDKTISKPIAECKTIETESNKNPDDC